MSGNGKRMLESALALPPVERVELVEEMLSSLDFPARADVDALWAREAEDRIAAYEKGELIARPAEAQELAARAKRIRAQAQAASEKTEDSRQ